MNEQSTDVVPSKGGSPPAVAKSQEFLVDAGKFEHLWRVAKAFAASSLVPQHFRGKPEDCFIAAQLAVRLGVDVWMLLQSLYVVRGKPGMESKLMIALLNGSGRIRGTIQYDFFGKAGTAEYGCRAWVIDAHSGERVDGPPVTWKMVKAEGWDRPRGKAEIQPKWATMPEQMFRYRAAAFLIRAHYPDVVMGMLSREEIEDTTIDVEPVSPTPPSRSQQVAERAAAQIEARKAELTPADTPPPPADEGEPIVEETLEPEPPEEEQPADEEEPTPKEAEPPATVPLKSASAARQERAMDYLDQIQACSNKTALAKVARRIEKDILLTTGQIRDLKLEVNEKEKQL